MGVNFEQAFRQGRAGESAIARWLIGRGCSILPVYEKIINEGKGPQLFTGAGELIAPDLVCITNKKCIFVEAKHKTAFSWHRNTGRFVTGIDLIHYESYQGVRTTTGLPVWLLFLQRGGQAVDSPSSPAGLFGGDLDILTRQENHRCKADKWGKGGMVYWARKIDGGPLRFIAPYVKVMNS